MERKRTYGVWAVRSSTSIFGPAQSWCKENGKPLEFDSKADAENYAKEANEHTTANVRYYVKEKEPEPGAVRKGTSQPELDVRNHEEVIPKNDAAEKQNEIPGRQIPSQTDPLVEIRSAVIVITRVWSLCWVRTTVCIWGVRNVAITRICSHLRLQSGRDPSVLSVISPICIIFFMEKAGRIPRRKCWNKGLPCASMKNLRDLQMGSLHSLPPKEKFLFAGQPFQAPESYLRNAELYEEGQTGNYNMLDGRLNNELPVRPDLTYGQTDEEIRQLVPEAKPSLMDRLKIETCT